MQTENLNELYIDIPRTLIREHAEELGESLTNDEVVEVAQLVVDEAFGAIDENINKVISRRNK